MVEIRNFVGGMDLDSSPYDVAKGFYLDALNITKNDISSNHDLAATNVVGNQIVSYTYPAGRGKYIGLFPFQLRNTVIGFRWNVNGFHGVYEYNHTTKAINKVFESKTDSDGIDILNFTENGKITSVNVYPRDEGDLLYFLDSLGRPTEMDIALFKSGVYTPVTRAIIDKGKMPPLSPPSVVYGNDTTVRSNDFRKKLTRYKYRWIYDDFEKSTFSPISIVPLPVSILSDVYTNVITNNNVVRMSLNSGGKNVKSIEIGFSFVEASNDWSDFQSIAVVDKIKEGIADDSDFAFAFYNDSTYPDIIVLESIQLFDYIPDYANAQDMPNGNVLAYAGITEGYDKDTTEDVVITIGTIAASNGGAIGNLSAVVIRRADVPSFFAIMDGTFSGIPATGTVINLKLRRSSDHTTITGGSYTTIATDTVYTIVANINYSVGGATVVARTGATFKSSIAFSTYEAFPASTDYLQIEIVPPSTAAASNSIPTWPWSSSRNIARAYFDQKGKTNGILYTDKVTFPAYAENGSQIPLLPFINYKINDVPPIWAYSMCFYFTKDGTDYKVWESQEVLTETEFIYLNVTSFTTNATKKPTTAQVCSYNFQDGDRLRIWRDTNTDTVYPDTFDAAIEGLVNTPTINNVVTPTGSLYLKIKNIAPFTGVIINGNNFVVFIYRPTQQLANPQNQVYYEDGRQYVILDPTLPTRRHSGEVTDQVVGVTPAEYNFYEGDTYFRARTISTSEDGFATFNVIDKNFVDFYISAVNSIDGRPNVIDINARRQYYGTLIRHGEAYQADTNVNGLNRFYAANFDEYPLTWGSVVRLKARDKYLKVLQQFKIGVVPLYAQITKDPSGNESLIVTDKLLNPIQYRVGNFGLTSASSLASWHFADYGIDGNTGDIWRDSDDGVLSVSKLYKVDSWALIELSLRNNTDSHTYATVDPKSNQVTFGLEPFIIPIPFMSIEASGLNEISGSSFTMQSGADFTVDWGDGTIDSFLSGGVRTPNHTYDSPYTGEIRISSDDLGAITSLNIGGSLGTIDPSSNALTLLTSEVSKLTGLLTLSLGFKIFLQGVVSDLPSTLTILGTGSTNLSGTTLQLPRGLLVINIQGNNTISGTAANLPPNVENLLIYGLNTITGNVSTIPRTVITLLAIHGNNTLSGDINGLPPSLLQIEIIGLNTISGNVSGFPASLILITISGNNTISGSVGNLPNIPTVTILGFNTITGNISTIPGSIVTLQIGGNNSLSGNVANTPTSLRLISIISSLCTINAYTSGTKTWSATMQGIILVPVSGGLVTADVDNLLIELAAQVSTWGGIRTVSILGGSQARSAASNAAVTTLNGFGVVVHTNP